MERNRMKNLATMLFSLLLWAIPATQLNAEDASVDRDTFVGPYNDIFAKAYSHYSTLNGLKAFALAVDANRNWAYGLGHNYKSQNEANRRALYECNNRTGKFNVNASCRLYAIDNKIVW